MSGVPHNITEIKITDYKFWDFKILLNIIKQCVQLFVIFRLDALA